MNNLTSSQVESSLAKSNIHQQWENIYHATENDEFFEQAFDYITQTLNAPENATFLDAGCGTCAHSIRLARRGFLVQAVDFSEYVLTTAKSHIQSKNFESKIKVQRENLVALSFDNESFAYILCWGVLMHIPNVEKVLSELVRVLKPSGMLVISESNMYSLQAFGLRILKTILRSEKADVRKTNFGIEYWTSNSTGALLTRETNIQRLMEYLISCGMIVTKRTAGQFTEAYTRVSSPQLKRFTHGFNNFYFKHIQIPHLAFGNILILRKKA